MGDDTAELEEEAYLRRLLADPDVRIYRGGSGDLVLELRALRMPGAAQLVRRMVLRPCRTSKEAGKPYRLKRAGRARPPFGG